MIYFSLNVSLSRPVSFTRFDPGGQLFWGINLGCIRWYDAVRLGARVLDSFAVFFGLVLEHKRLDRSVIAL